MKRKRKCKIFLVFINVLIVLILIFNSFAAVVSDNDGSAFITKAEYDSLKNDFQSQLDTYNTSIDSKIDSAISQYLSGIKVESKTNVESILYFANNFKPVKFSSSWTTPTTQIGDKYVVTSMFWWVFNLVCYYENKGRYLSVPIGMMEANKQDANITESNFGTAATVIAQPGYNSTYNRYYIDNESFWNILPKISIFHFVWHDNIPKANFWFYDYNNTNLWCEISDLGTLTNNNSDFGTKQFAADVYVKGGATADYTYPGNKLTYTTQTKDTFLDISTIPYGKYINILAGNQVLGSINTTKSEDWNTTELTAMATYNCGTGLGWKSGEQFWDSYAPGDGLKFSLKQWPTKMPKAEVYLKKNTDMNSVDLIHNGYSSVTNKAITYYSGIPIFNAATDGTVEIPLSFVSSSADGADFSIRNGHFNNTSILESSNVEMFLDKDLNTRYTNTSFTSDSFEKTIYFKVKKGDEFWIKVKPKSTNEVNVNTKEDKIIIYSENNY